MNRCYKILPLILLLIAYNFTYAQDTVPQKASPSLVLDVPVFDLPYYIYAAKTVSGKANCPDCKPNAGDFLRAYANPSMSQSLNISTDLYSAGHFGLKRLFRLKGDESRGKRIWKSIGFSSSVLLFDILSIYSPLGDGWLHEEYHRAVMTRRYVNSFNDINKFPLGAETVSVSHEKDEDFIRMKATSNADFVRMQAAGIEGEYMMIDKLQKNNFFRQDQLPNEILYWVSTINSLAYVQLCSTPESVTETNKFNQQEGANVKIRDFTGLDFCGWAYDLEHPDESYQNRGVHPSGVGINRYRTSNDLSADQLQYLRRQGNLQLLNLISPMMLGFRSIRLKMDVNGNEWRGNFALRHLLTSFGYDVSGEILYKTPKHNYFFTLHNYHNFDHWFPGVEAGVVEYALSVKGRSIPIDGRVMLWTQPHKQEFKTARMQPGGLVTVRGYWPLSKTIYAFGELEGKTAGWVAGNVFLNSNISSRWGLRLSF